MKCYWPCPFLVDTEREFPIVCLVVGVADSDQFTRFFVSSLEFHDTVSLTCRTIVVTQTSRLFRLMSTTFTPSDLCASSYHWQTKADGSQIGDLHSARYISRRRTVHFLQRSTCEIDNQAPLSPDIADRIGRRRSRTRQNQERWETAKDQETKDDCCCTRLEERRWSQG